MLDTTDEAKHILRAVRDINQSRNSNLTLVLLTDIFKGSDLKKLRESGKQNLNFYYMLLIYVICNIAIKYLCRSY